MHAQFLQQAIDLAVDNVTHHHGGPYGAVIVKEHQVIAASGNRVTANADPTAHAEIMAIRRACQKLNHFQLSDCLLYTSCEPCPMCLGAIYWARLTGVYYACNREDAASAGFDDSLIYQQISLAPDKRQIPMRQLALSNRQEPFTCWHQQAGIIRY